MPFDDPGCMRLGRIQVRPIHWLWRPYLACGKLALLDGDPGAGKSLVADDLAARPSSGGRMPGAEGVGGLAGGGLRDAMRRGSEAHRRS